MKKINLSFKRIGLQYKLARIGNAVKVTVSGKVYRVGDRLEENLVELLCEDPQYLVGITENN